MCSTHCKDFRDTWFVNFDQVFDFILILQVTAEIWKLNLNLKPKFDSVDQGADEDCDVASPYRPVPIRYRRSNLSRWIWIEGTEKEEGKCLTDGDELRRSAHWWSTAMRFRWTAMARDMQTRRGRRRRTRSFDRRRRIHPEAKQEGDWRVARASALRDVINGEVLWRENVRPMVRGSAEERGEERDWRGEAEVAPPHDYRWRLAAENSNSGERFPSDGGGSSSGSRGRWERGLWPWLGRV
jgi:hypothetical protein